MFERRQLVVAGVVAACVVLMVMAVISASIGSRSHRGSAHLGAAAPTPGLSPPPTSSLTSVPPATLAPADTPVQQQYDQAFASGLTASPGVWSAAAASEPSPAFSAGWPALTVANTPEQWVEQFTQRLLDIDFGRQSRAGLGQWLAAEEAPELLPGVPSSVADKVLYLSVFNPAAVGANPGLIPDATIWQADAAAGVQWSVSDLLVGADAQFSQIVAAGWQPVDARFAVEDVAGLLTATAGRSRTVRHFSMAVYVGSARWHAGYGTVLVGSWKEV